MKNKILLLFAVFIFSSNSIMAVNAWYDACMNGALGSYFINYWNEGSTYANTVYDQTAYYCHINYRT